MKKRTAWLWVLLGVTLGACGESIEPLALEVEPEPDVPSVDLLALIDCSVEVSGGTMTCAPSGPSLPEGASGIIVGSQGENVLLTSDNVGFKADSSIFHADVTVQNLIGQALGTIDGVTAHADGLRIFYVELPAATGETGPVTWRWSIPEGVEEFHFSVAVSAEVQYPNGSGIYLFNASPILRNLIIRDNYSGQGGAMWIGAGEPIIYNTVFLNNQARQNAAAVYMNNATKATFVNVTFYGNKAAERGVIMTADTSPDEEGNYGARVVVINSIFANNSIQGGTYPVHNYISGGWKGPSSLAIYGSSPARWRSMRGMLPTSPPGPPLASI